MERNVILQEIGQSLDTPDDIIDWLQETAYPVNQWDDNLGPAEKVRKFDKRDLSTLCRKITPRTG